MPPTYNLNVEFLINSLYNVYEIGHQFNPIKKDVTKDGKDSI